MVKNLGSSSKNQVFMLSSGEEVEFFLPNKYFHIKLLCKGHSGIDEKVVWDQEKAQDLPSKPHEFCFQL